MSDAVAATTGRRYERLVALVTGSTSGIGEATARRLAAEGATVVVNSRTGPEQGWEIATAIGGSYVGADIADDEACADLVETIIERHGRLDVLVNNAGTTQVIAHEDIGAATPEVFRRIFDVNVIGTWQLTRHALPYLAVGHAGSVVNVTSIAGVRPTGSSIPYAASKAALNHMTALLANVVGPAVRVNAVAPGLIRTPWTADWGPLHDAMSDRAPLGRSGEPEDVAAAIADVGSSPYLTGAVVVVDGGLTLR